MWVRLPEGSRIADNETLAAAADRCKRGYRPWPTAEWRKACEVLHEMEVAGLVHIIRDGGLLSRMGEDIEGKGFVAYAHANILISMGGACDLASSADDAIIAVLLLEHGSDILAFVEKALIARFGDASKAKRFFIETFLSRGAGFRPYSHGHHGQAAHEKLDYVPGRWFGGNNEHETTLWLFEGIQHKHRLRQAAVSRGHRNRNKLKAMPAADTVLHPHKKAAIPPAPTKLAPTL